MKPNIVVVGSANTDMVVRVTHLPQTGETVLGGRFVMAQGGKGANQAVAAARLGLDTFGDQALSAYQAEGIDTRYLKRDSAAASGVALILVDEAGENVIAVAPGANGELSLGDVRAAEDAFRRADCLLLQLEIPLATVQEAAALAHHYQVPVVLNPAPAAQLPDELLKRVSVLTPNENEAALLAGASVDVRGGLAEAARALYAGLSARGVKTMIVTLGEAGALLLNGPEKSQLIPGFKVQAVDTVACGDAFSAAIAVALARRMLLPEAVRYANAAGALTATKPGAQPSLPTAREVEQFLK